MANREGCNPLFRRRNLNLSRNESPKRLSQQRTVGKHVIEYCRGLFGEVAADPNYMAGLLSQNGLLVATLVGGVLRWTSDPFCLKDPRLMNGKDTIPPQVMLYSVATPGNEGQLIRRQIEIQTSTEGSTEAGRLLAFLRDLTVAPSVVCEYQVTGLYPVTIGDTSLPIREAAPLAAGSIVGRPQM